MVNEFLHSPSTIHHSSLFVLFVRLMLTATAAELVELQASRCVLFVLCRHVVALFALRALQNDVISRHFFTL